MYIKQTDNDLFCKVCFVAMHEKYLPRSKRIIRECCILEKLEQKKM